MASWIPSHNLRFLYLVREGVRFCGGSCSGGPGARPRLRAPGPLPAALTEGGARRQRAMPVLMAGAYNHAHAFQL